MKPDVFHFKQFSMTQAPSGQRVNTDSCAFGALIGPNHAPKRILDIGTGTGVLALMLAVRFPGASITAVEPESQIAEIARLNFEASPWSDRIELIERRAQDLDPETFGLFDFVLCNPPYFQNSLISDDRLRMVARHNTDLDPRELFASMRLMMTRDASVWLSFPDDSNKLWLDCGAEAGLFQTHHMTVKDHPEAVPHMTIAGWRLEASDAVTAEVIHYREERKGPGSPWMKAFRDEWYPERYNAQFY